MMQKKWKIVKQNFLPEVGGKRKRYCEHEIILEVCFERKS
jgi:hypothetical protein